MGQLQVYQLDNVNSAPTLSLSHDLDMPGILDIKWARQQLDAAAVCGLVNAKGELQLWTLRGGSTGGTEGKSGRGEVVPECLKTVEIAQCIGLSLDWAAPCEGYSMQKVQRLFTSTSFLLYRLFFLNYILGPR